MTKIFVIAGNRDEANQWIKQNLEKRKNAGTTTLSWSDYVVVNDPIKLRGYVEPHGVFIGSWRERSDIEEIVEILTLNSTKINGRTLGTGLQRVRDEIRLKSKKPTPKLRGITPVSVIIDELANQLSDEIDKHVLKELMNAGNIST